MSPEKNIEKVLEIFQMIDTKPSSVPLQSQEKLTKAHYPKENEETEKMQAIPYASACGSLMYAMVSTRLDIANAIVVSRFMSQLDEAIGLPSSLSLNISRHQGKTHLLWQRGHESSWPL